MNVNAADNVGVTKVELYVGGVLLATDTLAPWSFSWDTTKKANGTYAVNARAYDAAGHVTASAYVNITVSNGTTTIKTTDTAPPTVAIASPTGGTVSGIVPVNVNAADNVGVTKVELYVGGVLLATDTLAPWSFSWDTTKKANGTYAVNARAYDAAGHVTASPYVNITVSNSTTTTDTTAPIAHILSPVHATCIGASMNINVLATDNVAMASISVYIDGVLIAVANAGSLAYIWDASHLTMSGWHKITAIAKDKAGNAGSHNDCRVSLRDSGGISGKNGGRSLHRRGRRA